MPSAGQGSPLAWGTRAAAGGQADRRDSHRAAQVMEAPAHGAGARCVLIAVGALALFPET
jgi:hypothetical protein